MSRNSGIFFKEMENRIPTIPGYDIKHGIMHVEILIREFVDRDEIK